ncbi:valine--tRNA ligase [Sporomusa sphaeroides]|uniref:Valine--tRNA ligase n=2 Tax=Sporomusa TaxID=2375 RepID=A0ABM9W5R4_9FIRM|nr:valine--tRNA ligase [Sporomusa sphaeroides]OLS57859.1 valine--tRNA ligase [Sporomusa sphaeroides DSM 2875]CVK20372.1 Valine--tRNA ligase [Sporomusa sphaeroides DSM 2875]SCM80764.1 Valine--tRNA ligase [uncultured Sporomusa sp.]
MEQKNNIPTVYDPQAVEAKWYAFWEENNLFHAKTDPNKQPFSIVIPPPNVTGQLHMGHALDNTLQDILIRFKRLQGYDTLWMPGTDHAGIATQIKVEEMLAQDGKTRYDLGRETFIDRVWDWKAQYGSRIINQLKRLGASCDWQRERFTMDEGCSKAVREVFVSLYEQGLIYQGNRITNWCPRCNTALSDIEVEHEEQPGNLYHVRYPVEGADGEYVTVATTRPETILGDSGVAVHPEDARYKHLLGKYLVLPLVGRRLPIVADEYVDPSFGTGAVKVTPAHDPNDFDMGLRHKLPEIVVINPDGTMAADTGKYAGIDRYECRKALVDDLKAQGYLVKIDEHNHAVGHCQRCSTIVEPLVSKQWFVKMEPLAKPAIEAVTSGNIQFVPERFTKTYTNWLENIRDWCISRQIWWGHRIPAWYCGCGEVTVSRDDITACPKCGGSVEQDPDVLDTWFSSALWPFSTMGWPENTAELKQFYPTSVLVTGYDIIFFWVARMIMMGLKFQEDIPFRHVFIHGLVRDSQGRKMSKSLGNGIDPLDVIDKYGADTLRFMLVTGNTPGNDMRFYWERVESSRNFANKIWNASRFVLMNLEGFDPAFVPDAKAFTLADKWILSRYNQTVADVTRNLERFELGEAARMVYEFIWDEFCDWYIELAKGRLYNKEDAESRKVAQYVLSYILGNTLTLLHPFMPFITEAIWQSLPHQGLSIMTNSWPVEDTKLSYPQDEQLMGILMEVIKAVRNMRAEVNVPPGKKSEVILKIAAAELKTRLEANSDYIRILAAAEPVTILAIDAATPENAMTAVANGVEIYLPLKGLIDVEKETARLNKEMVSLDKELSRIAGKLDNPAFTAKAPAEVIEKEKIKQTEYLEKQAAIKERLAYLAQL